MKTSRVVGPTLCFVLLLTLAVRCLAARSDALPSDPFAGIIDPAGPSKLRSAPRALAEASVFLEPYGVPEGSVIDPSGGILFVRFDPPFDSPYTIESISFQSRTRNGVPAVFPSVRICGSKGTGQPDFSSPLFSEAPFVGSSDGLNTIPVSIAVTTPGTVIFVAIEFPLRGPSYPLDHPGVASDFFDLDRGYFSATYFLPTSGFNRQLDFVNAVVSARYRPTGPTAMPIEAPTNLSANRIGGSVIFSFEPPGRTGGREDRSARLPPVGYELLWRGDFGPWRLAASSGPGRCTFVVDSLPLTRSRWAVRSFGPFGNRSQLSNVEILERLTKVSPQTSWGPEEPNGDFEEASPALFGEASIFPSGDRDFYAFTAHAGDVVRIGATIGAFLMPDRDTLDLAAALYDDHRRLLAFDDNSVLGRFPQIDFRVPEGRPGEPDKRFIVEFFDVRGSRFAPGTSHRPASSRYYEYWVEVGPQPESSVVSSAAPSSPAESQRTQTLTVSQSLGGGHIRFVINDPTSGAGGTLRVFDARGRLLQTIEVGSGSTRVLDWSGRDDAGRSVAAGVYFARFTSLNSRITKKFILVK